MGMAAAKLPPEAPPGEDGEETVQFNFRIPKRLLAALDAWLGDMNRGRRLGKVTRAEVLRAILERDVVARPPLEQAANPSGRVQAVLHDIDGRELACEDDDSINEQKRIRWFLEDHRIAYRAVLVRKHFVVKSAYDLDQGREFEKCIRQQQADGVSERAIDVENAQRILAAEAEFQADSELAKEQLRKALDKLSGK